eukprot:m.26611 g.26611  ORF g.26611 m.26611 type:complete len:157 (+) comp29407_c0_seq16:18-488(+)
MASVVVEGLCSSSKGRLSYDRDWNTSAKQIQETLKRLSDQPTLSSSAFQTDSWRWRESSEGIQLDSPRNDSRSSTSTEGELEQPLNRTRHAFPLTPIALEQKLQTSKVNASLRQHEKEGERRVNVMKMGIVYGYSSPKFCTLFGFSQNQAEREFRI